MKGKIMKQEKGITLIALVITIIVLLILAGVAISMLSGENGILKQAGEAKTQTENKSEEEQIKLVASEALMASKDYTVTKENLKKILSEKLGVENTGYKIIDIVDGWEIVVTKTGNHYSVFKEGSISYLEWYYKEDPNNQNRRTIVTNGEIELNVGDYINYNSADTTESIEKTTYTSPTGTILTGMPMYSFYVKSEENLTQGSGNYTEQIFNAKAYTGNWKVLGVDEKTGEILIISADTVQTTDSKNYVLNGPTGVQYGETELNNICKTFGYGIGASGARSINMDDVNRLTGYNPNNVGVYDVAQTGIGTKSYTGEMYEYGNKVTYKWTSTAGKMSSIGTNDGAINEITSNYYTIFGFNWYDGSKWRNSMQNISSPETITTITSMYYDYYPETLNGDDVKDTSVTTGIKTTSPEYRTIFFDDSENSVEYWVATSYVLPGEEECSYGIYSIWVDGKGKSGVGGGEIVYDSTGYCWQPGFGVRPVVSLKTNIKLNKSSESSWTIQK